MSKGKSSQKLITSRLVSMTSPHSICREHEEEKVFNISSTEVAVLGTGEIVAVWRSDDGDIFGQRFDNVGRKVASKFQINLFNVDGLGGYAPTPIVTSLRGGGFVVAWHAFGPDNSSYVIYAQHYNDTNFKIGPQLEPNRYNSVNQVAPKISALSNGDFVLLSLGGYGQNASIQGVYGQIFDAKTNKAQHSFQVTDATYEYAITSLTNSGFILI